ncbi:MAG: tyrosine-type recombinase/integrase [Burkholderiales bacterium]|nr:tyrosine-type recombinase/integrase [Burkholderiales bacterium]
MATRRGNQDQYLQKVGHTYYARVRVPRTLEKYVGQTHIRRTLETTDRTEANRRKHAVVGQIKAELEHLRKSPQRADDKGISFAQAKQWREELRRATEGDDEEHHNLLQNLIIEKAEQIENLYGRDKAGRWYKAATASTDTLSELMDKWMEVSDYKESTKAGHRKALAEVLAFHRNDHATPADITKKAAIDYIDHDLTQRGLAHTTIRDRLVSLGGFWNWMASRDAVPPGLNPWTGHKISKKQNQGSRPPKRAYTEAELLRLLNGNAKVTAWPTYSYLPDLIVLGLFTGAREDELCSLLVKDIEVSPKTYILHIRDSKTKAGIRVVAVTHEAPIAVLKRRIKGRKVNDQVFPELTPGGLDGKLSASAVKAYGRYRRACDVPDGTDFHSYRRNLITVLEAAGVGQVAIARFVGHKVGTLAGDTYSEGGDKRRATDTAKNVRYSRKIEEVALRLAKRQ